jgi:PPP family 3-phenylpropionic acid transporter
LTPQASLAPFGALWFTYFASIALINPYAPLWYQSLGFSTLAIGAMASLQAWTRVLAPYAWSWAGDHWGHGTRRATLVRVASALVLACACGLLLAREYAAVAITMTLLFCANGAVVPLAEAALAQRLATERGLDVARYGRVRMWGSLGFIVAVLTFGALLQRTGIGAVPICAVLVCAALCVTAWRLPNGDAAAPGESRAADGAPAGVWAALRRPGVPWFFGGVFLTVLAHTSLYAFFSLYLTDLGYDASAVGLLWAVSIGVEVLFFWSQGRWFALWHPHAWLVAAAALSVLRFGAMALFGRHAAVLVAAQALHAFTFAAQHAACIAVIDRHFPGALRGRGQALYSAIGYGASGVIGGVAGGAISARWGFGAVFGAAAGVALLALGCCLRSRTLLQRAA